MNNNNSTRKTIITVLGIVVVGTILTGCSPAPVVHEKSVAATVIVAHREVVPVPVAPEGPLRIAVVGDSITSWAPAFALDSSRTWVTTANNDGVTLVGGWALPGAATAAMVEGVQPVPDAEVLVIMAGVNDIAAGVGFYERLANIEAIVSTVGAQSVVLSSAAPYNADPEAVTLWNATLKEFAARHGWGFIDPWKVVRTPWGTYIDQLTPDGVHPTTPAATIIGYEVHDVLLEMFR